MTAQQVLLGVPQGTRTKDDYYTPPWLFEDLGLDFSIDVAAPPGGVPWVPSRRFFTKEDDGLAQPWVGRVWMNPPFSKPGPWVERFMEHGWGVALLPTSKSAWLNRLWESDAAFVLLPSNLKFARDEQSWPIAITTVCVAMGDDCVAALGRLGRVR